MTDDGHECSMMQGDDHMKHGDKDMMMDHMKHDKKMSMDPQPKTGYKTGPVGGITGLEDSLSLTILLENVTTTLELEATEFAGVYHAKFLPKVSGYPIVNISGDILGTPIDLDMHPEKVEEISILPPLKQIKHGIPLEQVKCKEGFNLYLRTNADSAICASDKSGDRLLELGIVTLP
jgi:hypothetical protein